MRAAVAEPACDPSWLLTIDPVEVREVFIEIISLAAGYPPTPLRPQDAAWADVLLGERGLRS